MLKLGLIFSIVAVSLLAAGDGFSDGSGIEWHDNGSFALGMEVVFPSGVGSASRTQDIINPNYSPVFPHHLTYSGTYTYRNKYGCTTATLARIWIIAGGDRFLIFNQNSTTTLDAVNLELPSISFDLPTNADGGTEQIRTDVNVAGSCGPVDAEIELVGQWK